MESRENIFLAKLELMLSKFDELDDLVNDITTIIKENPSKQQQVDWELSDYYHKLEDSTNTDIEFINIGKKIREKRIIRNDLQCLYEMIKCYNENKDKLIWSPKHNREEFRKAVNYARKYLHEDYKYRVLSESDIKSFKKNETTKNLKVQDKISKETLEECFAKGMKGIDIARKYKVDPSMITRLKTKYGLGTRAYRKK